MKISRNHFRPAAIALGLVVAVGCAGNPEEEDVDIVESAVEGDLGGLDMEDEAPMFGDDDIYAALDLTDVESDVADDYATDAEVLKITNAPDAVIDHVVVMWGGGAVEQEWLGSVEVDGGAIIADRAIRFEGSDAILPRTDPKRVDFRSRTLRHRDGLRLRLAARADNASNRTLRIRLANADVSVDIDRLLDRPEVRDVGDAGDRVVIVAHRRPVDTCESGFMRGHWLQFGRGFGGLRARVSNSDGEGIGHIRGLYGTRRNGEKVFFGKYINRAGQFKGIFAGKYRSGHFAGRWLGRGGEHGVLGGAYRETLPGVRKGGGMIGRWAETSCNSRISNALPGN